MSLWARICSSNCINVAFMTLKTLFNCYTFMYVHAYLEVSLHASTVLLCAVYILSWRNELSLTLTNPWLSRAAPPSLRVRSPCLVTAAFFIFVNGVIQAPSPTPWTASDRPAFAGAYFLLCLRWLTRSGQYVTRTAAVLAKRETHRRHSCIAWFSVPGVLIGSLLDAALQ